MMKLNLYQPSTTLKRERDNVLKSQGPAFPFTRGFYLLCLLASAINFDLDNMNEAKPYSKNKMNDLLGCQLTPEEY